MQRAGSHESALDSFRRQEIDILVGTQMIAKGLDFPNVTLVGVVNADTSLHFPDFRASERTFGLVTQVAGRSGRGTKGGRVIVQTFSPEHAAITAAARHDYEGFAAGELAERESFGYPPFGRLARFVFRGESELATSAFAETIGSQLSEASERHQMPLRVLGPGPATIAKIKQRFRFHLLLFAPLDFDLGGWLDEQSREFPKPLEVEWIVDIDPLDML